MSATLADNIAALARQIEALAPGEDKAKLMIRFQRAAEDLAHQISARAAAPQGKAK